MTHRLLALGAVLLLSACEPTTGPVRQIDELPRALTASERNVIANSNEFAFGLLRAVAAEEPDENVFLSPLSVSMALGMTMNGAAGETYDEMRTTLGFGDLAESEINAAYAGLLSLLVGLDPRVEIGVANSIWYRSGFDFEQSFFERVRASFGAEVRGIDFQDSGSVDRVNGWVTEQTRGRIERILESISPLDVMYLINATYFKGDWSARFPRDRTRNEPFFGPGGRTMDVRMMNTEGVFRSASTPEYQALELPYGGGAFAMTVVLPTARDGDVNALLETMDAGEWERLTGSMVEQELTISLPRFRLEYDAELGEALQSLGIRRALASGAADFTRMSAAAGKDLYVSSVKHSTFVDVHEEGTEAAAVTKVTIGLVSMPSGIRVDRPFLFAIRERHSGTILFTGRIVAPSPA